MDFIKEKDFDDTRIEEKLLTWLIILVKTLYIY